MRLPMLDGGRFRFAHRLRMKAMGVMSGHPVPDVVKLHFFRYDSVGRRMSENFQAAMRGPSEWTAFERETMAAYVSSLNQCVF
jgi:hypothetical protein